jgi:plastocyanin
VIRHPRSVAFVVLLAGLVGALLVCRRDVEAQARASLHGTITILGADGAIVPAQGAVVWLPGVTTATAAPAKTASATTAPGAPAIAAAPPGSGRPSVASRGKRFAPHVIVASAGATVDFPNLDSIFHNAFSVSPGNQFDLGLYRRGASKSVTLATPGLVRVYCNIHQDMAAYVYVLDRAWPAVATDDEGTFRLGDLPAGHLQVRVWHEMGGEAQATVDLAPGQEQTWTFQLDARLFRRETHKNKYGQTYPPVRRDVDRY